jgi:asparagine synthase (glutamine-hydrolysing)
VCGVAGFLQRDAFDADASVVAADMGAAIAHRGPDHCAVWVDAQAGVAFSHQRLSILDLSPAGHQPMASHSGRFVVTYNGEIYNFRELRTELGEAAETHWTGSSDTEVLLAAFDRWGVRRTLERLNGMFAFAVWDRQERVLTLARDRIGEKPMFYGVCGDTFLFGSELKALQAHPGFDAKLDQDALRCMLQFDYVPAPLTIWQGISKLTAGHYVEIAEGGRNVGPQVAYWSLEQAAREGAAHRFTDRGQMERDLEQLLSASVAMRMVSDVPLGAFLSGGIDSSLIVALMQAQSPRPVRTFTIGFEEGEFDEAPNARAVATHLGTDHTELYVSPQDALDVIPALPRMWDEPFGDSSQIPTFLVSELGRRSVKVALSGDGGDELFGGYTRYRTIDRAWSKLDRVPHGVRNSIAHGLAAFAGNPLIPGPLGRAARFLGARQAEDLYRWRISRIAQPERLLRDGEASDRRVAAFGPVPFLADAVEKMMYIDTLTYLPENNQTKVDRASMAVSLEVRAPFLDHRVVEFAWRLPRSERLAPERGKRILRAIGKRHLPDEIFNHRKMGFSVPVPAWLRGPLRSWANDLIAPDRLAREGIFDPAAIHRLWTNFLAGKPRHDRLLWNILMFQAWHAAQS